MEKYDVYYYGGLMCYVTAKDLKQAKKYAERVVSELVCTDVNNSQLHVTKV